MKTDNNITEEMIARARKTISLIKMMRETFTMSWEDASLIAIMASNIDAENNVFAQIEEGDPCDSKKTHINVGGLIDLLMEYEKEKDYTEFCIRKFLENRGYYTDDAQIRSSLRKWGKVLADKLKPMH